MLYDIAYIIHEFVDIDTRNKLENIFVFKRIYKVDMKKFKNINNCIKNKRIITTRCFTCKNKKYFKCYSFLDDENNFIDQIYLEKYKKTDHSYFRELKIWIFKDNKWKDVVRRDGSALLSDLLANTSFTNIRLETL
jgi:hypothetical protein